MKRFTETSKWCDPWFRGLTGVQKLVFIYVAEKCNNAGFWEADEEGMAFETKLSKSNISGAWEGLARGLIHRSGWVWVRRFLRHQKNENLNPQNNAHTQIISLVREQLDRFSGVVEFEEFRGAYQGLFSPSGTGHGQVEVRKGMQGETNSASEIGPEQELVIAHGQTLSPPAEEDFCRWWWNAQEAAGWVGRDRVPIRRWKPALAAAWSGHRHNGQEKAARNGRFSATKPEENYRTL